MKTLGETIHEARIKRKYSREKLEKETKIKREFLEALEKGDWVALPEFPVVVGFVKNIANVLKINQEQAVALLRRDYPPRSLKINPEPEIEGKFTWSPRFTFLVGIGIVTLFILGYLGFQYLKFISPPSLTVRIPQEGQVVSYTKLKVVGKTDAEATVKVNNQPALVDEEGNFATEVEIFEGTHEIIVRAVSRSGKETLIRRKIKPELSGQK